MAGVAAHVTNRDVRAAQAVLDTLMGAVVDRRPAEGFVHQLAGMGPEWRGLLATWAADLREAGYDEGVQVGRRQAGNLVRDALTGEGL